MITPHLVEALLSGLVLHDEACEAYPDLGALRRRARAGGSQAPLQWALCAADLPLARSLLRHVANALLDLLDAVDAGWHEGERDACPLWHTLARAPDWLLLPDEPDDVEPDIALVLERDDAHRGDWQAFIEALHRAGSREWQWAIQRCHAMQRYEKRYERDVRHLLCPPSEEVDLGTFLTFEPADPHDPIWEDDECNTSPPTD